ncbi:MAG: bifunctional precorrin-2 dehydrogenase/sirohydrochlorin ferrochelatase [Spirochaetales bacterium]|nr:bifunctional precorrin-2 dehydrogenase/sirohydrochlorin ferrochelatase [Spirochaetales bacterium]
MSFFPLFVDLTGKPCVVVGGGRVAARRVRALLDFGACLTVIDGRPSREIVSLSGRCSGAGGVRLLRRSYEGPGDIAGARLVIAAVNDSEVNAVVARDARAAGIPVNAADSPGLCSFFFPALVRRGELVAGISTSGGCPRLAAWLRLRLEEDWPAGLAEFLECLRAERGRLRERFPVDEVAARLDCLISEFLEGPLEGSS